MLKNVEGQYLTCSVQTFAGVSWEYSRNPAQLRVLSEAARSPGRAEPEFESTGTCPLALGRQGLDLLGNRSHLG